MRPPRQSIQLLVLLSAASFLGCFALMIAGGLLPGLLADGPLAVAPTATRAVPTPVGAEKLVPPATPTTPGDQKALLIIGIDDVDAATPVVEGAWLITFRTFTPEFYVLAFPPAARLYSASLTSALPVAEIFAYDRQLQLNGRLVRDAVQDRFPGVLLDTPVILDRSDFVRVADKLGGVKLGGQIFPAGDVLSSYDQLPAADTDARAHLIEQALRALFVALGEQGWTAAGLVAEVQTAPHMSYGSAAVLDAFARDAPPLTGALLFWRTYVPELEIPNPQ